MMNKNKVITLSVAGALALATFIWSKPEVPQKQKRALSSVEKPVERAEQKKAVKVEVKKAGVVVSKAKQVSTVSQAPAPYFLNSENFKKYDKLLYKVVQSPEQKSSFNLALLDSRSLEDTANYLKNPSLKPGKEEKIYHLKASGFLIQAIKAHPFEFEVTSAVKEVLNTDLTEAKSQMTPESYALLKENKAELLYHALAVSEQIQQDYVASYDDSESQKLLQKVQALHASNTEISKKMIADR